jgi:hypothetical protein
MQSFIFPRCFCNTEAISHPPSRSPSIRSIPEAVSLLSLEAQQQVRAARSCC